MTAPGALPNVPVQPPKTEGRRRGVPAVVVLVVVAAVIAVIGFLTLRSQEQTPGETLTSFLDAVYDLDEERTCDLLAEDSIAGFEAANLTCEEALDDIYDDVDKDAVADDPIGGLISVANREDQPDVAILGTEIRGDRAEVEITIDGEAPDGKVILVREDGRWKIDFATDGS